MWSHCDTVKFDCTTQMYLNVPKQAVSYQSIFYCLPACRAFNQLLDSRGETNRGAPDQRWGGAKTFDLLN